MPDLCLVSGTLYAPDGSFPTSARLKVIKLVKNGRAVHSGDRQFTYVPETGLLSISLLRGSVATIQGDVEGFTGHGRTVEIPDAATATLESLIPPSSVIPASGFNFRALGDTPDSYTGQGGKVVGVKSDASGLEFVDIATDAEVAAAVAAEATARDAAIATASTSDRARTNHTGTQAISTVVGLQAALDAKALGSDLTAEASTRASADTTLQTNINAEATARSNADTTLQANITAEANARAAADALLQPLDPDLTAFAGLSPANDDIPQRKSGAWTNRTPAQFKTDLALTKSDVGLSNVDNTSDASKPVSTATQTALDAVDARVDALEASGSATVLVAYKTADESVTESSELQDDDHLTVTLEAGHKYDFKLRIHTNNGAGAMRAALGGTVTSTNLIAQVYAYDFSTPATAEAAKIVALNTHVNLTSLVDIPTFVEIDGSIEVDTGGTFVFQWAQRSSNEASTTVLRGSTLIVTQLD